MIDYEQLYYDLLYQNKKLKKQIEELEQELDIYKSCSRDKSAKAVIIESLSKYLIQKIDGRIYENTKN